MKRKTQLRLQARLKLKDSKKLKTLKTFSKLKDDEINVLIDEMDHIVRYKGDVVVRQYDVSDSFYIIIKGFAVVTVDVENMAQINKEMEEKVEVKEEVKEDQGERKKLGLNMAASFVASNPDFISTESKTQGETETIKSIDSSLVSTSMIQEESDSPPEQMQVAEIKELGFFGESALLNGENEMALRTATVMVASDKCELLRLKSSNFIKLMEKNGTTFSGKRGDGGDGEDQSVIDSLKATQIERNQSNREMMKERRESMMNGGVGLAVLAGPKGLPMLPNLSSGMKKNERSLFS